MKKITVYSTQVCPYCVSAKKLLEMKGLEYQEIMIDKNPEQREIMMQKAQRTSVPQIFIDDFHVGGFDDLNALNQSGELDKILNA